MMPQYKKRKTFILHEKGFTLIEIMIVLVVLGLLIAVALPKVSQVLFTGKVNSTKASFSAIVKAANACNADMGIWLGNVTDLFGKPLIVNYGRSPQSLEFVLFTNVQLKKWNGPYMDGTTTEISVDAWGSEISTGLVSKANFSYDGRNIAKNNVPIGDARWSDSFNEIGSVPGIYLHSNGEDTVTGDAVKAKDDIFVLVTPYLR